MFHKYLILYVIVSASYVLIFSPKNLINMAQSIDVVHDHVADPQVSMALDRLLEERTKKEELLTSHGAE